jgi:uncharacterized protein YjbI with pentapeptide repeats
LQQVNLRQANLSRMDMGHEGHLMAPQGNPSSMVDVDLAEANLEGAHLEGVPLHRDNLQAASLRHAYFQGTDMVDSHLEKADLRDTSFDEDSHLSQALLAGAVYDYRTRFPQGFDPGSSQMVETGQSG